LVPKVFKGENLVNINIEVSEDLHKKLKLSSIMNDETLKDHIIKLLEVKSKELKAKL
jgi:hypothetical protein